MKDIPKIFPLSLLLIIVFMFFIEAYSVAESALGDTEVVETASAYTTDGQLESAEAAPDSELDWYEHAAVWVCPLH